ncbi:MAG: phenylacetate--CoA ligase [Desulfovibrio sp.]|nr:phenylacetate--CoA ligase [Desulfovibrio sp.]
MAKTNYRFIPSFTPEQLTSWQLEHLKSTLARAWNSPQYRAKLESAGFKDPRDLQSLTDLTRLPTTDVEDLRSGYPLPLLCVPPKEVVRIHASSGTTGKRKILAYTKKDTETLALQMARCFELTGLGPEDRLQAAVGYGLWTAGVAFQSGSEMLGMLTIPVGPGNLDIHLTMLQDLGATCFGATASMALLLAEEVERQGLKDKIKLRKVICGSETRSEKMRLAIESQLNLEGSYDIAGMTEMYGPGTAIDCDYHEGLHYWADLFIIEILDPKTLAPVADGEVGEMVVTSLIKEAVPLIRYRTHDLSRKISHTCSCGLNMPLHDKILGRSDDMIIYRGVNIYPGQFSDCIGRFKDLGGEYQVELTRDEHAIDHLTLTVERSKNAGAGEDQALAKALASDLHEHILARIEVEITDYATLPRTFSKSKRIVDKR